jgi:sigma-B regulation protein RsbU (phosphoserine phosphatase)
MIFFENLSAINILNSLAEGVYVTDRDRRIVFWNRGAERITGYSEKEILGKTCYDNILVHTDKNGNQLCGHEHCPLHRAIVTETAGKVPIILFARTKSGERVPVQVIVSPIRNEQGEVIGGVESFRDLSELMFDLESASAIQKHAMSAELPKDSRVEFNTRVVPLEFVTGDFYRIERLDEDCYGILSADVSGHGVASALYTMQLRSLWEEMREYMTDPAKFVSRMNDHLSVLVCRDNYFATAVYGVLNAKECTFRYVGAGHPNPFLFRAKGGTEILTTRGLPLGMMVGSDYETRTLTLQSGDVLLFYSDAAVEQPLTTGDRLEEEGFLALLKRVSFDGTPDSLFRIEEALLKVGNSLFLSDDLTLISVKMK